MSQTNVAILGGGVGALTAAYYLTQPELEGRYKVTIYQQGFRLGGKCATGRGPGDRIEEHGLHMLMGYYERTFAMLRPLFAQWHVLHGAGHPFRSFDDAFQPIYDMTVMEEVGTDWLPWTIHLPPRPGKPGIEPLPVDDATLVATLLSRLNAFFNLLLKLRQSAVPLSTTWRRAVMMIKFTAVVIKGLAIDAIDGDLDKLNHLEIREWLRLHGLSEELSEWIPVRLMYDLGFAYAGGDSSSVKNGRAAAGVTLRVMLRCLLGYREAPLYKMMAGMADTVFTMFYRVLEARGVRFEFFHRVTRLSLAADGRSVTHVGLERQVPLRNRGGQYRPVHKGPDGLERWLNDPDWEQLAVGKYAHSFESPRASPHGEQLDLYKRQHEKDDGFDWVVLGISLGGLRNLSPDLERRADWRNMLSGITTVNTQAAQLWFRKAPARSDEGHLFCTGAPPFSTAADMSELLPREGWRVPAPVALHYVVTSLTDGPRGVPDEARVRENLAFWLRERAPLVWPGVTADMLYHPDPDANAEQRLEYQFVKVHHNPSDRYVQSFPGSIDKRLPSKLPGLDNLALAGDWVRTGLSVGCVESAVQGGIQAANAVRGSGALLVK